MARIAPVLSDNEELVIPPERPITDLKHLQGVKTKREIDVAALLSIDRRSRA